MSGFCNVWVCICVGFVMCWCVYVGVFLKLCGCFGNMCTCMCFVLFVQCFCVVSFMYIYSYLFCLY